MQHFAVACSPASCPATLPVVFVSGCPAPFWVTLRLVVSNCVHTKNSWYLALPTYVSMLWNCPALSVPLHQTHTCIVR